MKYLGDLSAVDPPYRRYMECYACQLSWDGCWDNFQCPKCGEGELPKPIDGHTVIMSDGTEREARL